MKNIFPYVLGLVLVAIATACGNNASNNEIPGKDTTAAAQPKKDSTEDESKKPAVSGDVQLKLPGGFTAIEVAPGIGPARHLVVNSKGNIYVKMSEAHGNKGIIELKDKNGD